jgi:hypothetical protein
MAHSPDEKRQKYSSESQSYSSESQEDNLHRQPHLAINQSPWLGQQPVVFQDDFPMRPIERIILGHRNGNLENLQRMNGQMGQMGPIPLLPKGPVLPGYENVVKKMEGGYKDLNVQSLKLSNVVHKNFKNSLFFGKLKFRHERRSPYGSSFTEPTKYPT